MVKFCMNCGKQLGDAEKFCTSCGAQQQPPSQQSQEQHPAPAQAEQPQQPYIVQPQQQYQQPQYQQYAPAAPVKKSKTPLIVGGIGGVCVIVLVVMLIVTNVFGLFGKSGGNTGQPTSPTVTNKPDPVNDPISTKALEGTWTILGTTWLFDGKGNFAEIEVRATSSGSAAYCHMIQGEYKVSGIVIKFTNCNISSNFTFSKEYLDRINNRKDALADLIKMPMPDAGRMDGFSAEFEFIDASRLRIRVDSNLVRYDSDFTRSEGPQTAPIPAHRIPPGTWPSDWLSPDMPNYTGDRVREVKLPSDDGVTAPEYGYVRITIDRTSSESFFAYIANLRSAGWSGPDNSEILDRIDSVNPDSFLYSSCDFQFKKGCFTVFLTVYPGNYFRFEISSKREIEGVWPSGLFGDEFKPPADAVLVGEIEIGDYAGKGLSSYIEVDFYPGTMSAYIESLKANGFADAYASGQIYKWIRLNGKMYKVMIDPSTDDDRFNRISYYLKYYPNFVWPPDIPPGITPPAGVELFSECSEETRAFYERYR